MNKSLGEVFRSAGNTVKYNFKALFIGILLYMIPSLAVSLVDLAWANYQRVTAGSFLQILLLLYLVFVSPLYMGYITSVLRTYHTTGAPARMETAWAAAKANYARYLLTMLATIVISFAVVLVIGLVAGIAMVGPVLSAATSGSAIGAVASVVGAMLPMVIVIVALVLFYSLCIGFVQFIPGMEFPSAFQAVFQSFRYVFRGNFWKTLGHMLVIGLITAAIELALLLPFYVPYISALLDPRATYASIQLAVTMFTASMPLYTLISIVVGIFVQVFTTPYTFEVYLNAKGVTDGRDSQQVQAAYQPYSGFTQDTQPPQNGAPPQIPPEDGKQ